VIFSRAELDFLGVVNHFLDRRTRWKRLGYSGRSSGPTTFIDLMTKLIGLSCSQRERQLAVDFDLKLGAGVQDVNTARGGYGPIVCGDPGEAA
jgi:hypothetical protein